MLLIPMGKRQNALTGLLERPEEACHVVVLSVPGLTRVCPRIAFELLTTMVVGRS